jgi:tetratricopeptide (TPR) repeat protein
MALLALAAALSGCSNKQPPTEPAKPSIVTAVSEPEPPEVAEAHKLKDRGDLAGATQKLRSYLDRNPSSAIAHLAIARCYFESGDPELARKHVQETVKLSPNDSKAWRVLGNILYKAQLHTDSERAFRRAVELLPNDLDALLDLGREQLLLHRYDESGKTFRHALEIAPNNSDAQFQLAAYLQTVHGDLKESEKLLESAANANPRRAAVFAVLGKVELGLNNPRGAVDALNMAASLEPENRDIWFSLAQALRRMGNDGLADNAQKTAEKLRKLDMEIALVESQAAQLRKDPAIKLKLAKLYEEAGSLDSAVANYKACLALQPDNAVARNRLARIQSQVTARTDSR